MTKLGKTKREDRSATVKYHDVGRTFLRAANDLADLATDDESYGNAIALLTIHAAIAYTDALTVAFGDRKSTDGDHGRAADLLQAVFGSRIQLKMVKQLRGLIYAKDAASYQGYYYTLEDARRLLRKGREFCAWAEREYKLRP